MKKLLLALCAVALSFGLAVPAVYAAGKGKASPAKKEAAKKETVDKAKAPAKTPAKAAKKTGQKKPAKKAAKPLPKSDWSPNNFPAGLRGWCTWYADGRFYKFFGEKLELAPRPGSNAHLWYPRAQNVAKSKTEGQAGDIMVIKRPKGDRTGHVAFVEDVIPGVGWVVSQANFDFGGHKPLRTEWIDGRKVTFDLFVPGPRPGTVRLDGGNSVYNLIGFIHKEENKLLALAGGVRGDQGGIGGDGYLPETAQLDIAAATVAEKEEVAAIETIRLESSEYAGVTPELDAENAITPVSDPDACGCTIRPRLSL